MSASSHALSRAVRKYVEFHALDARAIGPLHPSLSMPSEGMLVGPAGHIVYRSDKWERPKAHDYIHDFGPGVRCVLFGRGEPGRAVVVPARHRAAAAFVVLGTCLEFTYTDDNGALITAKATGRKPELYCTPSGRALFVVQARRTLLAGFWGGKLGVEARGIVG